jgi:hypothetical protein
LHGVATDRASRVPAFVDIRFVRGQSAVERVGRKELDLRICK